MSFTGTAVVEKISDRMVRITGLSLAALASGSIGLTGKSPAAEVTLPAGFMPQNYDQVSLADQIRVTMLPTTAVATAIPIRVNKGGSKPLDFSITLTNDHASLASPTLEIYVEEPGA